MHLIILGTLLLGLLFGPQLWARWIIKRHSRERKEYPGNGGQFARHLLNKCGLHEVKIEASDQGDHYDPTSRTVRLTPDKLAGKSLTAITVAAHEVGHAIQHHQAYSPLLWRSRLVTIAQRAEKTGAGVMFVLPVVAAITRSPTAGVAMFAVGLLSMAVSTFVHLVTLPVEWDASFGRAMPLLKEGNFVSGRDERSARRILQACALTYLAASLASLFNVWRWLRLWRR
jgi:Zn-dependent membrane protease YugP